MSTTELGKRLLGEVETAAGFGELLSCLQRRIMEASPRFEIPTLDNFLRSTTNIGGIPTHAGQHNHAPVIEILHTATGSGTTHILYHIATISILPRKYKEVVLNGRDSAVVFVDSDGRFDAHRLYGIMKGYIKRRCRGAPGLAENDISAVVETAMRHIHIFRPNSSAEVISILRSLPRYLLSTECHQSGDKRIAAVFIDSLSAFYWEDRRNEAEPDFETGQTRNVPGTKDIYSTIAKALNEVCVKLGAFAVATVWSLPMEGSRRSGAGTRGKGSHDLEAVSSNLPQSWNAVVNVRVVVRRSLPEQSTQNFGSVQTRSMDPVRGDVPPNLLFEGRIYSPRSWSGHQFVPESGTGVFHYRITDDGISFLD